MVTQFKEYDGLSWGAIFAGALGAAALTIILTVLGTGLGLAVVSPWSSAGISSAAFGVSAILWLTFTQIAASGIGGFLAGRLRVKWDGVDSDEIYFRDTAHGFLSWSIALIVTVGMFATVLGSVVNGGSQAAISLTNNAVKTGSLMDSDKGKKETDGYFLDVLFRKPAIPSETNVSNEDKKAPLPEVSKIYVKSLESGGLQTQDIQYLTQLVVQNTGITSAEAEQRVNNTYMQMHKAEVTVKEAADKARKNASYITLWGFIALLIGAFTASISATCGGKCRKAHSQTLIKS